MSIQDSPIYHAALQSMLEQLDLSPLQGKTLLITGATGMIGSCMTDALLQWIDQAAVPCTVIASGRREDALRSRFSTHVGNPYFQQLVCDITQPIDAAFQSQVDFILHIASNSDPIRYARFPVDTLLANVSGINNLLTYGRDHGMKRFLYVSSGEMYGQPNAAFDDFTETYCGPVDHSTARACYPVGKRAGEVLCQCFISQYDLDAVIVRPCHVFGPTMTSTDTRAASAFLRNAARGQDIVMKSAGTVERSHCYVIDAVQAMLLALLKGKCGEAYNIADPAYQMQIRDFAQRAAAAGGSRVIFENPNDVEIQGYSKVSRAVLDASKLMALGWHALHKADAIAETVSILREA